MAGNLSSDRAARLGQIGGLTTSSRHDPSIYTAKARETFLARFLDDVDPNHELPDDERQRRALAARRAHFARLALASAESRRQKRVSVEDEVTA
jgi:hypothetical protein